MNYITTKLSYKDKKILDKIYEELEKIRLSTSYCSEGTQGHHHAMKLGVTSQRDARQAIFGLTTYRGKKQISKYSKIYPHIMQLFQEFINSHQPDFNFQSVYVNRNTVAKKHLDSKNTGESLLVGVGKFTGGETVLYTSNIEEKFNIQTHSLIFNGSEIEHSSKGFEGTRYSLVFFN